jgi:hypothetical protein
MGVALVDPADLDPERIRCLDDGPLTRALRAALLQTFHLKVRQRPRWDAFIDSPDEEPADADR